MFSFSGQQKWWHKLVCVTLANNTYTGQDSLNRHKSQYRHSTKAAAALPLKQASGLLLLKTARQPQGKLKRLIELLILTELFQTFRFSALPAHNCQAKLTGAIPPWLHWQGRIYSVKFYL